MWEEKTNGRRGLAPGLPPGAALLTVFSLESALPPPRPRARPVFAVGIWARRLAFIPGVALRAFCREAGATTLLGSPGADGPQWESTGGWS